MGQAQAINRSDEIKLETNIPQTFALKFSTGKAVGQWGNTMFTAVDSRRIFLNAEDAGEFEHALADMRIQPAEFIRVTRVKHGGRGGGFSIRVERVEDETDRTGSSRLNPSHAGAPEGDTRTEALLEKSVEMARNRTGTAPAVRPETAPALPEGTVLPNGNMQITPASARLCACLMAAVDAAIEASAYAKRKGFDLQFTSEDVRTMANTLAMKWRQVMALAAEARRLADLLRIAAEDLEKLEGRRDG